MKLIALLHRYKHEKYQNILEFLSSRILIQKLRRKATKMTQRWEGKKHDYMRFVYINKIKKHNQQKPGS